MSTTYYKMTSQYLQYLQHYREAYSNPHNQCHKCDFHIKCTHHYKGHNTIQVYKVQ
jgi:hypothetical protein